MRSTSAGVPLFAAGALLGWATVGTLGRENNPEPGAKAEAPLTPAQLVERTIYRRAVEAVIWGMPAVNYDLMYQAMIRDAKGGPNQIVYWSRLSDWKNQTLTPNPDTIYLMPFFDTKNAGPMVLEIPPAEGGSITGTVMDSWQCALEDVGPAGADKGKGGKYLVLPPGYKDRPPDDYIALPSDTFQGYALLRSNLKSGGEADVARALAYGKQVKLYPLARAADPPATKFVDAAGAVYDSTIPYDQRFFESLDRFVQAEPWLTRDKAMIEALKSVGIEKGKPFKPDPKTLEVFKEAAREARACLDTRYEANFASPFYEGGRWALPVSRDAIEGQADFYAKPGVYPLDGRGVYFSIGFFSAKHLGEGQFYLMTIRDKEGRSFDGGSMYRLRVPANPPVKLYWSATIYDRATHALIRDQKWSSRSSTTPGLQKNADGSVDVYFGPKAPEGKESNWVPTRAGGQFEVLFRFYGPEKPLFDKTWTLPDIASVK
jgi:hypothetical protein